MRRRAEVGWGRIGVGVGGVRVLGWRSVGLGGFGRGGGDKWGNPLPVTGFETSPATLILSLIGWAARCILQVNQEDRQIVPL